MAPPDTAGEVLGDYENQRVAAHDVDPEYEQKKQLVIAHSDAVVHPRTTVTK